MHKFEMHDGKWIKTDSKDYTWYVFIYIMFRKVKITGIDKISGLPDTEKMGRIDYKGAAPEKFEEQENYSVVIMMLAIWFHSFVKGHRLWCWQYDSILQLKVIDVHTKKWILQNVNFKITFKKLPKK